MIDKITSKHLASQSSRASVAVLVDGQNVNVLKYNRDVLNFVANLGEPSLLWFFHHWSDVRPSKVKKVETDGWEIINVREKGKNALDYQAIKAFREHCEASVMPDILVLITCDKDFLPLVKDHLQAGREVFVIGRRNAISHRLLSWVGSNFYWVEELHLLHVFS